MKTTPCDRLAASVLAGCLALGTAACSPEPAEVKVQPKKTTVYGFGKKAVFSAEVVDGEARSIPDAVVSWKSANPKVATIDSSSGVLQSVAAGRTTVTATLAESTLSGSAVVEVVDVASATLSPTRTTLAGPAGSTFTFTLSLKSKAGAPVSLPAKWVSSDPKVLTVDSKGTVTSVAEGSSAVTVSVGDIGASAGVRVTFKEIASLELAPATIPLKVGELGRTSLVARDPSGQEIPDVAAAWSSGDTKVATVSGGVVLGIGPGSTTIRASCGTKVAEVSVLVY